VLPLQAIVRDRLGTIVASWTTAALDAVLAAMPGAAGRSFVAEMVGDAGRAMEACRLLGLGLRDRVLAVLTTLARDFGVRHPAGILIDLRMTHAELAALAAGSRANVTRALEGLRARALVLVDGQRFVVTAPGLVAFADAPAPSLWRACG
jgi:CRP-like cAMP-binding protein